MLLPEAVTPEDVIAACGGTVEPEAALPEYQRIPPAPEKETRTVKKLPVWRKILAAVSGIVSLVLIVQAIGVTDLTKLIDANGMTALAGGQLKLYGILLLSLLVFALSIGRKADRPDYLIQTPVEKRKLQKRTVTATLLILLLIPLTLFVGVYYFAGRKYYFISLLILLECMLPFFLIFEGRKPQARELVLIAVLVALNVAGRAAFFMLPEFKPVVAMTILAGVAFGGETGFLVGAMTMLVSNMLFSQGPWTPWQMFAMGINRLAGRRPVPQGCPPPLAPEPLHLRRHRLHRPLRRHYESRVRPHVVQHNQLENHPELLRHRHPHRPRPRPRHLLLPLAHRRTPAPKTRPHQNQIRLSGIAQAVPRTV